ncbi:MAG: CoA-binding protein [Gemmatimonadota bacterium]|nr:MAG: CoA-binding protein [Gemmatimonadota bacterium]
MDDWDNNILETTEDILAALSHSRRIAVLGIKPATHRHKPAHSVPEFLQQQGYEIIPVPVYYPEVDQILGQKVYRRLTDVPGGVDIVDVFRKPADIPQHIPDLIAKRPTVVWFQKGIRNDMAARELARAGIKVVQDRCTAVEHRRLKRR